MTMIHDMIEMVKSMTPYDVDVTDELDRRGDWEVIGTLTIEKFKLLEIEHGTFEIPPKFLGRIEHKAATDKWPAYEFLRVNNISIHLCNGVKPDAEGRIRGNITINCRRVTPSRADARQMFHLAVSILPAAIDTSPTQIVMTRTSNKFDLTRWMNDHSDEVIAFGPDSKMGCVVVLPL